MLLRILLVILPLNISAQTVLSNSSGAKNEALGSPVSITGDEWSLWRNPAGLTTVEKSGVSSSICRSAAAGVLTRSCILAASTKAGSFGAGISSFGDELYNEALISIGFANRLGLSSVGIRADAYQLRIDGEATMRTFGITVGCIARITQKLSVGICARNVNLPTWTRGQPLPVVLNSGVSYTPGDNFMIVAEVEKNTDFDPTFKSGFEYSLRKKVFFRTGVNLFPNAAFGGIGLRVWRCSFDYSLKFGYLPGSTQQLSVTIRFRR